ncbi:MAG: cellulose biosynthesis cyclic di-GMP-binding regulatory protein BcsB [Aquabacterium sp.]
MHKRLRAVVVHLAMCWMCLGAMGAGAAPVNEAALSFARLLGSGEPVRITGSRGELQVFLPLPAQWQPGDLTLKLSTQSSQALLASSQLAVSVNGHVVAQQAMGGGQTRLRVALPIPAEVLKPGYNDVRLQFVQHHLERCEYPEAPELWTDVDVNATGFVAQPAWRPVSLRLDRLDALFDRLTWQDQALVPVLTARQPAGDLLTAMGLVAQAVGQRYDYVPVRLTSARLPTDAAALKDALPPEAPGAIVLGTIDELRPLLGEQALPQVEGGIALLRAWPGDDTRFLLMLVARQHKDLPMMAAALAMPRLPWPDQSWALISDLRMPPLGSVTGAAASLKPATNAYPLSALGFRNTTYSGTSSRGASLRFWNAAWQGRVQVRIHAAYAAGLGPQSALNVMANGVLHGAIPLNNPAGGVYDNYAVSLPAGALRPGWNTLELKPVLIPQSHGGDCQPYFPGNLALTVYEDSTLQTFGGSPMRRPDLALVAFDGRPLPTAPVGVGMGVQLTDADDATVGAGLTLMAKLQQVFKGPMLRTRFGVGEMQDLDNSLWVGRFAALPLPVRQAAGLGARFNAPVPLIESSTVAVLEGGDSLRALRDQVDAVGSGPTVLAAGVTMEPGLADRAAALSRLIDDRPVTVFTAADSRTLEAAMRQLVRHGPWSQLRGELALWRPDAPQLLTVSGEDAPFVAYSLRGGLGLWVSQYPWWALFILLSLLLVLVWLTRRALGIYRLRNLPPQPALRRDDKGLR